MQWLFNIDGPFDWPKTQVRDAALKIKDELPKSDVNREYYLQVRKERNYFQNVKTANYDLNAHLLNNSSRVAFRMLTARWLSRRQSDQEALWASCLGRKTKPDRPLEDKILCVRPF